MSVYSGFATRQQQSRYNQCLQYTLSILAKRLTSFYLVQECSQAKFQASLRAARDKMEKLEEHKHMLPHFSRVVTTFLGIISEAATTPSQFTSFKGEELLAHGLQNINRANNNKQLNFAVEIMQCREAKDQFEAANLLSQSTLKFQQRPFGKRTRTLTPDKRQKCMSFTPIINKEQTIFLNNDKQLGEEYLKNRNQTKIEFLKQTRQIKRLFTEVNIDRTRPLSPRQFLRNTIQGNKFGGKNGHRTKIRHQKIV